MPKRTDIASILVIGVASCLVPAQSPADARASQPKGFQIAGFTGCGIPGSDPRGDCARAGTEADLNAAFARCRIKPTAVILATDGVKVFVFERVRLSTRLSDCLKAQIPKDIQANTMPMFPQ